MVQRKVCFIIQCRYELPIALIHIPLVEVQSLQKSDDNANRKGFMQGLVRKDLKKNMWKYEVNCVHIHHGEIWQVSFSSCRQKSHIQSNELRGNWAIMCLYCGCHDQGHHSGFVHSSTDL